MINTTKSKIALVGSAPSSVQLAPYGDPEWAIVGCSPGAYPYAMQHAEAWFEIHRFEPQIPGKMGSGQPWFSPEYVECLTRFKGDVWMIERAVEIPGSKAVPVGDLVSRHSPYFFNSSLSWMLAMAIETPGVEEIGLWGVDMAAHEEYKDQRLGCQHFIKLAVERGIKITIPPESDLLQPPLLYGVTENDPMHIKLTARQRELQGRLANAEQQVANFSNEATFLRGAIDDLDYMIKTWVTERFINPTRGKTGNEVRAEWGERAAVHSMNIEKKLAVPVDLYDPADKDVSYLNDGTAD